MNQEKGKQNIILIFNEKSGVHIIHECTLYSNKYSNLISYLIGLYLDLVCSLLVLCRIFQLIMTKVVYKSVCLNVLDKNNLQLVFLCQYEMQM